MIRYADIEDDRLPIVLISPAALQEVKGHITRKMAQAMFSKYLFLFPSL